MYRFIVIDDEYYVRQRVKLCIPWETYGFMFSGEAANTEQALQLVHKMPVDLAIVDISMPGKNGLELIRELKELDGHIRIIILSGYATFEYARQAIRFGVTSYLLKPIDTDELIHIVVELRTSLDHDFNLQQERQEHLRIKYQAENAQRNLFFRSLFARHMPRGRFDGGECLEAYGIWPHEKYFAVIFDLNAAYLSLCTPYERDLDRYAIENVAHEIVGTVCTCISTVDIYGHPVLLCRQIPAQDKQPLLERVSAAVRGNLRLDIIFGYSMGTPGTPEGIVKSYQDAMYFYTFKTIYGVDRTIFEAKVPDRHEWELLNELNGKVHFALELGDEKVFFKIMDQIFAIMEDETYCFQALESEISALLTIGINYSKEHNLEIFMAENDWVLYSCSEITHAGNSITEIRDKLKGLFSSILMERENVSQPMIYQLVTQAAELIGRDFKRYDMGLKYVSSRLLISPAYLSRNFRKIRGVTIMKYITKCRMEQAKTLLEGSNLTVAQISDEVGYHDLFYFSKSFKKYFGVSPTQYRTAFAAQKEHEKFL